jgi:hypothetical protein
MHSAQGEHTRSPPSRLAWHRAVSYVPVGHTEHALHCVSCVAVHSPVGGVYVPAGQPPHGAHTAFDTAVHPCTVYVRPYPQSAHCPHTVSAVRVQAAIVYSRCAPSHARHGEHTVSLSPLHPPLAKEPLGHDEHVVHRTSWVGVQGMLAYWPAGHTLQSAHPMSLNAHAVAAYVPGGHPLVQLAQVRSFVRLHAESWYRPAPHWGSLHAAHCRSLVPPHAATWYVPAPHSAVHALHSGARLALHPLTVYVPAPHGLPQGVHALLPAFEYVPTGQGLQYPSRSTSTVHRKAGKSPTKFRDSPVPL